ncbi:unnamed protein product [Orchesella dallaii]|uniref:EF-hand domain-containing protein n=1 Tax=Orchesella dallaii TaxID=48710 RepID=A0ABP1QTW4_9HEXA
MSGEVDLKKASSRSRSSYKTNTSSQLGGATPKESLASSKSALGKVDSSSKGNISSSIAPTGTTFSSSAGDSSSSIETNTAAADSTSSSINDSHSHSSSLLLSQSTSNKHAASTVPVSSNPTPLCTTTTKSKGNVVPCPFTTGEVGVNPSKGKSSATFISTASSNPAVPCEGAGVVEESLVSCARSSSGLSNSSAGNSPRIPRKEGNNNNNSITHTNVTASTDGGSSPKLTFNPSFEGNSHQNNQNPRPHSQEKTASSSSSTSLSARLSLKSLGRRRSPVRTQFTLPTSSSSAATTGTDQIPTDSISAQTNPHSVVAGGGSDVVSSSCVTVNNSGGASEPSRGFLRRSKKERGASSSASPPLIRSSTSPSQQQQNLSVTLSSSVKASSSSSSGTNPTTAGSSSTVPADPNIPWVPGTSAPITVDRAHSVKITRKILHNWRSACGRTKDRTKDLIRRWKTLPENHPDFDLPPSPGTSKKKVSSTSNLNNNSPATKKKLQGENSGGSSSGGGGGATSVSRNEQRQPSITVTNTELQSSRKSSKHQQRTENEMPVVGIGKGSLASGDGAGSGSASSAGGTNSNLGGGSSGGRLSAGMTGIGRPSISVNNSSSVVNGRTSNMDTSGAAGAHPKSSTGWTVHVWATYVQRDDLEQGLDNEEPKKPDREYLSDFQKVKLTHFFRHVLDMNHDDVISAEDFVALNQRIRHYIEWSSECIEFHILKEVHSGFLECFLNQPLDDCSVMYYCNSERETRQHVNIDEWLDVWGGLLHSARTMEALPLWLQYFPKILFQVINKSGSGTISREELRAFYTMFLGIDFRVVNETLEAIHKAMTDGGRHKITYDLFKLCFANFLLGKYPNGPGQYLFGICSPQTLECSFPIDYSALNTHPDDLEPYDPEKDKSQSNRRSVIV